MDKFAAGQAGDSGRVVDNSMGEVWISVTVAGWRAGVAGRAGRACRLNRLLLATTGRGRAGGLVGRAVGLLLLAGWLGGCG